MKISVDDTQVFELEEWEKKLIKNDIPADQFEDDMKRRLKYILKHKCDRCYARLEKEWLPILQSDPAVSSIPASKEEFVNYVTSRSDYLDRSRRDRAAKKALE